MPDLNRYSSPFRPSVPILEDHFRPRQVSHRGIIIPVASGAWEDAPLFGALPRRTSSPYFGGGRPDKAGGRRL
jgi:hypothetical protein